MRACLFLSHGASVFDIADVRFSFQASPLLREPVQLPIHFESFAAPFDSRIDIGVVLKPVSAAVGSAAGVLLYESRMNWRVRELEGTYRYEWYHPPSAAVLIRAEWRAGSDTIEIGFDLGERRRVEESYWPNVPPRLSLLPPFEQLPFLAPFARRDAILVHACGAVRDGRAYVFAGHSGDGKTTLSRLLSSEGLELLSDERVVIRRHGSSFMAYGTPWPGEGNVVNAAGLPLAGVFLLHKANEHEVRNGKLAGLASEFLARTIVPYYLRNETEMVLSVLQKLTHAVPFKELHFAKKGGLADVLSRACP